MDHNIRVTVVRRREKWIIRGIHWVPTWWRGSNTTSFRYSDLIDVAKRILHCQVQLFLSSRPPLKAGSGFAVDAFATEGVVDEDLKGEVIKWDKNVRKKRWGYRFEK